MTFSWLFRVSTKSKVSVHIYGKFVKMLPKCFSFKTFQDCVPKFRTFQGRGKDTSHFKTDSDSRQTGKPIICKTYQLSSPGSCLPVAGVISPSVCWPLSPSSLFHVWTEHLYVVSQIEVSSPETIILFCYCCWENEYHSVK